MKLRSILKLNLMKSMCNNGSSGSKLRCPSMVTGLIPRKSCLSSRNLRSNTEKRILSSTSWSNNLTEMSPNMLTLFLKMNGFQHSKTTGKKWIAQSQTLEGIQLASVTMKIIKITWRSSQRRVLMTTYKTWTRRSLSKSIFSSLRSILSMRAHTIHRLFMSMASKDMILMIQILRLKKIITIQRQLPSLRNSFRKWPNLTVKKSTVPC